MSSPGKILLRCAAVWSCSMLKLVLTFIKVGSILFAPDRTFKISCNDVEITANHRPHSHTRQLSAHNISTVNSVNSHNN